MNWNQKIIEIGLFCNCPTDSGRNIAITICNIDSDKIELYAISGKKSRVNNECKAIDSPTSPIFKLLDPPPGRDRKYDSEYKLLEEIASRYTQNQKLTGTIELFTQREMCISCEYVLGQFQQMFPNIKVTVTTN